MAFITYKKFGKKEYAYEIVSYWDNKVKQPRLKEKAFERRINPRFWRHISFAKILGE